MTNEKPSLVHLDDLESTPRAHGENYAALVTPIAPHLSARKLGYRLVEVPPGKRGWPFHHHYVNEEMFFILAGEGELRHGDARHPIRAGHVIAAPPGGAEQAHQLINTGSVTLRYLAVSTMEQPDVFGYPDSGKFGLYVGSAPGGPESERQFEYFGRKSDAVDYWEGE
jgi:uncharacterized cupin superfamily protein